MVDRGEPPFLDDMFIDVPAPPSPSSWSLVDDVWVVDLDMGAMAAAFVYGVCVIEMKVTRDPCVFFC